jgi:hypothetical protein
MFLSGNNQVGPSKPRYLLLAHQGGPENRALFCRLVSSNLTYCVPGGATHLFFAAVGNNTSMGSPLLRVASPLTSTTSGPHPLATSEPHFTSFFFS